MTTEVTIKAASHNIEVKRASKPNENGSYTVHGQRVDKGDTATYYLAEGEQLKIKELPNE